ncbi:SURF1 family protein [mine drainage metagenome]|uniref:SURF1 family protein n=1 Tax=mine drainage metagenome TaxID=410659 RepID=A0A1J5Q7C3_9ZZZZ
MSSRWWFLTITGLTVLGLSATLALGRWQLSRASQKEAWASSMAAQSALPPIEDTSILKPNSSLAEMHRRVTVRGHWLARNTVFLDNRQMNNKPGFYVVTPLKIENTQMYILIQRGWVARNFLDRSSLPPLETPSGLVEIKGRIAAAPAKLYDFGGPDKGRIRQNLDVAAFSVELGKPLLPVSVQQLGPVSEGLLREWPPFEVGVEKHYGYALQWFSLSALIIILYVWFQIVRRFIHPRRA